MAKLIVGKFNKDLTKIDFYQIIGDYGTYTIIKKTGSNEYYAWDNKERLLSENLHIADVSKNKNKIMEIIKKQGHWYMGEIFFWADSKFVTEYGLPAYDRLIELYKQLKTIKGNELQMKNTLLKIRFDEGFFIYFRARILASRFIKNQRKVTKKLEKEFRLIW